MNEILSAAISAIGTVFCGLLSFGLPGVKACRGLDKKVIQNQMERLYSPMVRYFDFHKMATADECIRFIFESIYVNFDLVSPQIYKAFDKLIELSNPTLFEVMHFMTLIESNYHWSKKVLGFPYDGKKIYKDDLPVYGKYKTAMKALLTTAFVVGLISTVAALLLSTEASHGGLPFVLFAACVFPATIFLICTFGYLITFLTESYSNIKNKRQIHQ